MPAESFCSIFVTDAPEIFRRAATSLAVTWPPDGPPSAKIALR